MTDHRPDGVAGDPDADPGPGLRGVGLVALGGAVGTLARAQLQALAGEGSGALWGTFVENVTGAFLLGLLLGFLSRYGVHQGPGRDLRLLLGTGLLGGYTTYSLLATDVAALLLDVRIVTALGYGVGTLVLGLLAAWAGLLLGRARVAADG